MLTIETDAPPRVSTCDCCGGRTTSLTRFVYSDGDAFAVYYAAFGDSHPEREVEIAVSLGDWSEDSSPEDRNCFALLMREAEDEFQVTVLNAAESPWNGVEIIGRMLDREEALAHPEIEEVFHITDHMVIDDPEIKSYFEPAH